MNLSKILEWWNELTGQKTYHENQVKNYEMLTEFTNTFVQIMCVDLEEGKLVRIDLSFVLVLTLSIPALNFGYPSLFKDEK